MPRKLPIFVCVLSLMIQIWCSVWGCAQTQSIGVNKLATTVDQDLIKSTVVFQGYVGNGNEFRPTDRNPRAGSYPVYPDSGSSNVTVLTASLPRPSVPVTVTGVVLSLQPTVVQETTRTEGARRMDSGLWAPANRPWLIGGAAAILLIILFTAVYTKQPSRVVGGGRPAQWQR